MKPWMEEFIARCIKPIPDPGYRRRLSAELSDHLAALEGELLDGSCPPEEARAAALAQMGDPAELAAGYLEGWRQRMNSPRHRAARVLFWSCFVGYAALMGVLGVLYIVNTQNFGKPHPGYWGVLSLLLALALLAAPLLFGREHSWGLMKWLCWLCAAMQILPALCWVVFGGPFEMSGIMVSNPAGLLTHVGLALWSAVNADRLSRCPMLVVC